MADLTASLLLDLSQALQEIDQLSSDIDAATSDVSLTIDVESSVDEVQSELDSLSADSVDVDVNADVSDAEAEIQGLDADPISVPVEADTGPAEESLGGLGETAAGAATGFDDLGGAAGAFGGIAGAVTGDVSGLAGSLGSFGPQAAAAAAGGVAVAGAFQTFSGAAIEAIGAEQRFAAATGDLGEEIRSIEVGGLNDDLGDLAISLGGSDEAALDAASNLVRIGEAAGATDSEISTFTEGLFAFEAAAIASGLASGSLGDNTQRLASGFARGGRFLQNFGVSLTSAEIAQQALLETGKTATSQLTQFEKAQAGVNLALAQNPNLAAQVAAGQNNIEIQIARTKAEFGEFIEELGRPLAPQFVEILEKSAALAQDFAPELAAVSEAAGEATIGLLDTAAALAEVSGGFASLLGAENEDIIAALGTGIPQLASKVADGGEVLERSFSTIGEKGSDAAGGISAVEQAAATAAQALPSLGDSFSDVAQRAPALAEVFNILNAESDPAILAANIQAQADAINAFSSDLETIAGEGFEGVAAVIQQQGPEVGAGYADALATALENGDVALAASLANAISNFEDASVNAGAAGSEFGAVFGADAAAAIQQGGSAAEAAAAEAGSSAASGLEQGFSTVAGQLTAQMDAARIAVAGGGVGLATVSAFAGSNAGRSLSQGFATSSVSQISSAMNAVRITIASASGSIAATAGSAGFNIGSALGSGIRRGVQSSTAGIAQAARDAVNQAEAAARAAADINSPSRVFQEVGSLMGEGLALGFEQSAAALIGEAEAITVGAAGAVGSGGTNVGGVVIQVDQTVQGDPSDYRTMKQASRRGIEEGARELARIAFDSGRA